MTEAEWLACEESESLLLFLSQTRKCDRKVRLFGCSCLRSIWNNLADIQLWLAVQVAENFADGFATVQQLEAAQQNSEGLWKGIGDIIADHGPMAVVSLCELSAEWLIPAEATAAVAAEAKAEDGADWNTAYAEERRKQSVLIRDIFGNPFQPVNIAPAWRTPDVLALSQAAYDERIMPSGHLDSARLLVLADALTDAGCDDTQLLDHLRSPGPHVRGCYAIDALLSKE